MNKEDLKHGNVVETREGFRYLYIKDKNSYYDGLLFNLDGKDFDLSINNYRDDLACDHMALHHLDIMKVYKNYTCQELLWKRKETSHLTDDEITILRNIDKRFKYITRDEDNRLFIYKEKPYKNDIHWSSNDINDDFLDFYMFDNLFQFIKWEDDEPYLIEDLLKEQEDDDNNRE